MKQQKVIYNGKPIAFSVERRNRKTLEIQVRPDLTVVALAPIDAAIADIKTKIVKRGSWILKKQRYFMEFFPRDPPRQYQSGETHMYLGNQYRLKVEQATKNEVKMKGPHIWVKAKDKQDSQLIQRLLYDWYRAHANVKFNESIERCLQKTKKYGIERPNIVIMKLKKRWGSCVAGKYKVLLNLEMIRIPMYCIDYVVAHELCHLKYDGHDPKFYNFLTLVMPDWRERKAKLKKIFLRE